MSISIAAHFQHQGTGQTRRTSCRHCGRTMTSHAHARWEQHLRSCLRCPPEVQSHFQIRRAVNTVVVAAAPEAPATQPMARWTDTMDAGMQHQLDRLFAKAIVETGVPFRLADSSALKAFLQALRPAWTPPSSRALRTTFLNEVHHDHMARVYEKVRGAARLALVTDRGPTCPATTWSTTSLSFRTPTRRPCCTRP